MEITQNSENQNSENQTKLCEEDSTKKYLHSSLKSIQNSKSPGSDESR